MESLGPYETFEPVALLVGEQKAPMWPSCRVAVLGMVACSLMPQAELPGQARTHCAGVDAVLLAHAGLSNPIESLR